MTIQVTARIQGLEKAERMLRDVAGKVRDLRPLFRGPIDAEMTKLFRKQFETRGRYGGQAWPELTPATMQDKGRRHRAGMGILRRTNRLWASLVKSGGPESHRVIAAQHYERGTYVPYAIFHQLGAVLRSWGGHSFTRPRRLRRRMLIPDPFPPRVAGRIEVIVADWLEAEHGSA